MYFSPFVPVSALARSFRSGGVARHCACLAVLGSALLLQPGLAGARPEQPILKQVTNLTEGSIERLKIRRQKGASLVFVSDGDVMGPGTAAGHREIYYYDTTNETLQRATDSGAGESWAPSQPIDDINLGDRAEFVAFVSTADLDPDRDNSDGNPEIFVWEIATGLTRQITDTLAPVVNDKPFASDSGRCIVFSSSADLADNDGSDDGNPGTGFSNPDGSLEVFQYSLHFDGSYPYGGITTQVSNGPAGTESSDPVVGGYWFPRQCQSTSFVSDHDQLGEGVTGEHLYVYSRFNGQLERMTPSERRLPFGVPDGDYNAPHISGASNFARGPYLVFTTAADVWNNLSTGLNLFRYRIFHPELMQLTDLSSGNVSSPEVSDGGGKVLFAADGELLNKVRRPRGDDGPLNADGNSEIFRLRGRTKVHQFTRTEGCENTLPTVRDDATAFAFVSTCDLIPGLNPDGVPQVFHYQQVKRGDPLLSDANCVAAEGCCSEANGCYTRYFGKTKRVSRKNCAEKGAERCER